MVRSYLGLIVCRIFEFTELCRRRERRLQVRDREVRVISLIQTAESSLEAAVTEAGLWAPNLLYCCRYGSVKLNVLPFPGSEVTQMRPLWASTIHLAIKSPRPRP